MGNIFRIVALLVLVVPVAAAQEASEALPDEIAAQFEELLEEISAIKDDIATLEARAARREGVMADLLTSRRDDLWTAMFRNTVTLAKQVAAQRDIGRNVTKYWDPLIDELSVLPSWSPIKSSSGKYKSCTYCMMR